VLLVAGASYALRPESRRLVAAPANERSGARGLTEARA
jgi:hypothetical protein